MTDVVHRIVMMGLISIWLTCTTQSQTEAAEPADDDEVRSSATALAALDVGEGLQATLFAAEPMLLSPANIDVDHRGRVWVCEVVNYRHFANRNNPLRKKGDRILILEDTDGDGKADKKTVFYQGRDIDSAHGVCVLGNRVIVSALDKVLVFTDHNGDDEPDKKEVLFSGISGAQHDHGIHSFTFGPDGRLYFNCGNMARQIQDKHDENIVDLAGNIVAANRNPYQEGMIFRCNLDGSDFETLGWNFRNNWELAVDSYGTIWQSDNDDDGNRSVRINFVMEFGNYGYKDERTGAGWRTSRTGMHAEIPKRHWHLNDPGVVPNLLQTGAGSPTGILVYEGRLLPKVFWDQLVHCDAGPNVVRAYPVKKEGAGYKAEIVNMLHGARDQWFRPADVCVAPDGSLIIADWYDPGVGGHRMGDVQRGRLFRITPSGHRKYKVPMHNVSTAEGAVKALLSPNVATRYLARTALHKMQQQSEPALAKLYKDGQNPRHRARALWLLGDIDGRGRHYVERAIADRDPNIRITGLRLVRRLKLDVLPFVQQLTHDPSPQVRRECALALRHSASPQAAKLWAELAAQHDGKDRWYLEALGIGADRQWDRFFEAWLAKVGGKWNTSAGRDILWRSRAAKTTEYLARIISSSSTPMQQLPRYFRAFDLLPGSQAGAWEPGKNKELAQLAFATRSDDSDRRSFIMAEAVGRLKNFDVNSNPRYKAVLDRVLNNSRGTSQFVALVEKLSVKERYPDLLKLAQSKPAEQIGVEAIRTLLTKRELRLIKRGLADNDRQRAVNTALALGNSADGRIAKILLPLINDNSQPVELRRQAVISTTKTQNGARELLKLVAAGQLDAILKDAAASSLHSATSNDVKKEAAQLFPLPSSKDNKPLPPLAQLMKMKGDVNNGRLIFNTTATCAKCHIVNGIGKQVGPNLSEIGGKLSRQANFDSILFPSAGISHNYETYTVVLLSGNVVNGIVTSRTPDSLTLKGTDAIVRTFKGSEIEFIKKENTSLMPADIQKLMTAQELVDVVEYMVTLKQAAVKK